LTTTNSFFPIQVDFETTNLTFNTVDEDGNIQRIEPTTIDEYLYEQIISIDNEKIEIGLVVWKNGIKKKPGQHILILMTVKNIILTELQSCKTSDCAKTVDKLVGFNLRYSLPLFTFLLN
jgi:hypothetical protein